MSSILKALKKVEQEESRDENGAPSWPDSVRSSRQSVKQESRKKIVLFLMVTALCVFSLVMIFMGLTTYFFSKPGNTAGNGSALEPIAKIEKGVRISDNPAGLKPNMDHDVNNRPAVIASRKDLNQRPPTAAFRAAENQPAKINQKTREASIKASPVVKKTDSTADTKEDELSGGKTPPNPPPDVTERGRVASLPEIKKDPRINIQAIAWAEEPDRRFAVINNAIIREGGSVEGITVVSIKDDMVLFSENGNEWRQQFVVR